MVLMKDFFSIKKFGVITAYLAITYSFLSKDVGLAGLSIVLLLVVYLAGNLDKISYFKFLSLEARMRETIVEAEVKIQTIQDLAISLAENAFFLNATIDTFGGSRAREKIALVTSITEMLEKLGVDQQKIGKAKMPLYEQAAYRLIHEFMHAASDLPNHLSKIFTRHGKESADLKDAADRAIQAVRAKIDKFHSEQLSIENYSRYRKNADVYVHLFGPLIAKKLQDRLSEINAGLNEMRQGGNYMAQILKLFDEGDGYYYEKYSEKLLEDVPIARILDEVVLP
jgi:hypothetical protein